MAILNFNSSVRTTDGGQTTSTIVTANNIGSYAVASNATYYIGTTQNVFNRASGAQTLTGISIDGNAATVTNGVYTTGTQTIGGAKTFSDGITVNSATYNTFSKPSPSSYQTVALFGSASGGLFLTTDAAIIGVGAYYNTAWIATDTSGRQINFAGGNFTFSAFSGATVGGLASWGTVAQLTSAGVFSATGDFRAPIFYDSNNTAYYVDPASTTVLNRLTIDGGNYAFDYFQSLSDFTNGTLVTTDIPATAAIGLSFVMNVVGKSYNTTTSPFDFTVQGYLYDSTIINYSGMRLDSSGLSTVKIFENGGFLCFWWARVTYWNAFEVSVRSYDTAKTNYNRVTNITDAVEPTGTKKVTVTLQSFLRADVSATNTVDLRAPIFYDSDNTAYYINAASSSNLNTLTLNGIFTTVSSGTAINFSGQSDSIGYNATSGQGTYIKGTGNTFIYGGGVFFDGSAIRTFLHSNNYGAYSAFSGSVSSGANITATGYIYASTFLQTGGNLIYPARYGETQRLEVSNATNNNWIDGITIAPGGIVTAPWEMRSPIFYDSDNTSYYVNPASTSNLVGLTVANTITGSITGNAGGSSASCTGNAATTTLATKATRANGNFYIDDNYGNTVVGLYSAYRYQGVFAMGDSYKLAADGTTTGTLYGIAWSHPFAGGTAANLSDHGALILLNGTYAAAISSSIRCTGDMRTPIYYDSNDTSYYVDPASFSLISSMGIGGLTSSNNVQMYDSYVNASSSYLQSPPLIIRKDSSATGAIDQAPVGLFIYNLNGTNNTWTKLSMGNREAAGAGNTVSIAGLAAQKTAGTANGWATGNLHFWTKAGITQITNMVAYSTGYVQSDYSFRSPIFYDSDDTGYYVDPNSISRLSSLRIYSAFDTASSDVYANMRVMRNNATTDGMYIGYGNSGSTSALTRIFGGGATTGELSKYSTYTLEPGSFRSPTFYDSDNTAYYIDAASTSNLVGLTVANTITGSITGNAGGSSASCTGNAATATILQTARNINGTSFNGSAAITTATWGTARTLTIGSTGKSVDGSANVSWSLAELGAAATNQTMFIGTTSVAINRASASQTLTGVSIDGNAANITAYTINQNVGTANTPSFAGIVSTAMLTSSTSLSNNYDWQNSPITIRERGLVSNGQSSDIYSPNINFHWSTRWSSSLWMNQNGNLNWGHYSDPGVPGHDGVFRTGSIYANIFYDSNNTAYYLDPASTSVLNLVRTTNTFGARNTVTASSSTTIDTAYNLTELTMSASITTLTLSNIQASAIVHMWTIVTVGNGTTYSITWPAAIKWPGGAAPTITATNAKRDIYQFVTYDGGTTIYAIIVGQNL